MKQLFGADGIRSEIDEYLLRSENVERIGRSIAGWLHESDLQTRPIFLLGTDTRESCQRLKAELLSGLTRGGIQVIDVGILPTAAVSFLIANTGLFSGGAIISASHSPATENGIKIFDHRGVKVSDEQELIIEELFFGHQMLPFEIRPAPVVRDGFLVDKYINDRVHDYKGIDWGRLKILIDCANGAGSKIFPRILNKLGIRYSVINAAPNGININWEAGSEFARMSYESFSQDTLSKQEASIGIFFDGDADRVVIVDTHGKLYDGNMLIAILALILRDEKKLTNDKIVTTRMSNSGLSHYLDKHDIKTVLAKNGDKYVTEVLINDDLNLGGEAIGHIIIHDSSLNLTGDGLRTALHILRGLVDTGADDLRDLAPGMYKWPQIKVSVPIGKRTSTMPEQIPGLMEACQSLLLKMKDIMQLECRPASTEPVYRIMLETQYTPVPILVQEVVQLVRPIQKFFGISDSPITIIDCTTGKLITRHDI
jgi:phosphoglucosamine mutase